MLLIHALMALWWPFQDTDFKPGTRVLWEENFTKETEGDFPVHWNTDASGKLVRLPDSPQMWLELSSPGVFLPENLSALPENFTLEFDLRVPASFSYYDYPLGLAFANVKNHKDFSIWGKYKENRGKRQGFYLLLHPQEEGGKKLGFSEYESWEEGQKTQSNRLKSIAAFNVTRPAVKVQIWRQGQRLRVYLSGTKIWDLPRAFTAGQQLNTLLFTRYEAKVGNYFYLSNFRLASSGEDNRSRLLEEGKYATTSIQFESGSARLREASDPALTEIAGILKDVPTLKVRIVGHTDSEGQKADNQALSLRRAEAVKAKLVSSYGISAARLETGGKGDSEPLGNNGSAAGRQENRRVEFIKI